VRRVRSLAFRIPCARRASASVVLRRRPMGTWIWTMMGRMSPLAHRLSRSRWVQAPIDVQVPLGRVIPPFSPAHRRGLRVRARPNHLPHNRLGRNASRPRINISPHPHPRPHPCVRAVARGHRPHLRHPSRQDGVHGRRRWVRGSGSRVRVRVRRATERKRVG
jgi:hypothetical protein